MTTKLSQSEINELLEIKVERDELMKSEEERKEKVRGYTRKRNVRLKLMYDKGVKAGITVTDKEIESYIKSH